MRVLFIGDVVGAEAVRWLAERLPSLRRRDAVDLVVVNAENAAVTGPCPLDGFGMTPALVGELVEAGVDVVTSGNHAWDGPQADRVLGWPQVLRPCNVPGAWAGRGALQVEVGGAPVTVVNLTDVSAIAEALPLWPAWEGLGRTGTVLVDLHSGSVNGKLSFAAAVDGSAAAVLGTHTHEPTCDLHVLPGGTAVVTDVGMTGPTGGVQGIERAHMAAHARGDACAGLPAFQLASGPIVLGAVLLDVVKGRTQAIRRITA
jgi:metallophosphoesterase (TIGR00282 family)